MTSAIKSIFPGLVMAGPAITCTAPGGNWLTPCRAYLVAQPGDVIVIDTLGCTDVSVLGELYATSYKMKEIAGVVVDGCVRDIRDMKELNIPIFARGTTPRTNHTKTIGDINVPIQCGGVKLDPGDIVYGDDDGVVIIPKEIAAEVLEGAKIQAKKQKSLLDLAREKSIPPVDALRDWELDWEKPKKELEERTRRHMAESE